MVSFFNLHGAGDVLSYRARITDWQGENPFGLAEIHLEMDDNWGETLGVYLHKMETPQISHISVHFYTFRDLSIRDLNGMI